MKYILILVLGLIIGGAATIFFLGAPRAKAVPGARVQAPAAGDAATSKVVVEFNDRFFGDLLDTVFKDLGPPSFNLAGASGPSDWGSVKQVAFQEGCVNKITLAPEGSGMKTQVQFSSGKISAPLAFSGSYNFLGSCTQFKGWAQTSIELTFDQSKQTVYGRMNVEGVNLEGVAPFANNFITVFVRTAIDQRVNPLEILRPQQLQLLIPVKASNGSLKAQVKDVRAEVQEGTLRMHVMYDFSGAKGQLPQG